MASGPITSWEMDGEMDGEMVETVSDFILGGSKITADGDCSQVLHFGTLLLTMDTPFLLRDSFPQ